MPRTVNATECHCWECPKCFTQHLIYAPIVTGDTTLCINCQTEFEIGDIVGEVREDYQPRAVESIPTHS